MLYSWDIIGHKSLIEDLETDLKSGNLPTAYLFFGPPQTGKARLSKTLAAIIQCPNNYCQACTSCKAVFAGTHPDVLMIGMGEGSIKIETIRDLIRKANLTRQKGRKIILIKNIENMVIEAQNAFLKTLEEPPGNTLFILTSSNISRVLPTIQSRTRKKYCSNISDELLADYLSKKYPHYPRLSEVIEIAQGRPGLALKLINDPAALAEQKALYEQIEQFIKEDDLAQKFLFADELAKNPESIEKFLDAFMRYLRKLMLEFVMNPQHPLKNRLNLKKITKLFEYLEHSRYYLERNVNKKLVLENLFIITEK